MVTTIFYFYQNINLLFIAKINRPLKKIIKIQSISFLKSKRAIIITYYYKLNILS